MRKDDVLLDDTINAKALFWMETFCLSHHLHMADALIAATAESHGLDLLTGNTSDYSFLPGLTLVQFNP